MASRTGVYSLLKVAKSMCRLILLFEHVLIATFPSNTALHAAVVAAAAACHTLRLELEEVREWGD